MYSRFPPVPPGDGTTGCAAATITGGQKGETRTSLGDKTTGYCQLPRFLPEEEDIRDGGGDKPFTGDAPLLTNALTTSAKCFCWLWRGKGRA